MLAVATRFSEIATGSFGLEPPEQLIHTDINPKVFNANYPASISIEGDSRAVLKELFRALQALGEPKTDYGTLQSTIKKDKEVYLEEWLKHDSKERVNPARFFLELRKQLDDNAIVVADDGNHTFLTAELMPIFDGGAYLSPTDFNCMGYCVPATIGAKLDRPDRQVVGIVGDGAFLMTAMESLTAVNNGLGVAWFVFNDGELSQIAQAQQMPYQRTTCTTLATLDYSSFAQATGCAYVAIGNDDEIEEGVSAALDHMAAGRPVIVDVRIDYSKKTRFTIGTVKTNVKRFDTRNKLRIVSRALWRKLQRQKSRS